MGPVGRLGHSDAELYASQDVALQVVVADVCQMRRASPIEH